MKPKTIYFVLCFIGAILPYWQFVPWVLHNGMNLPFFVHELFVNRISAFFGMGCSGFRRGAGRIRAGREQATEDSTALASGVGGTHSRSVAGPAYVPLHAGSTVGTGSIPRQRPGVRVTRIWVIQSANNCNRRAGRAPAGNPRRVCRRRSDFPRGRSHGLRCRKFCNQPCRRAS